MSRGRPSCFSRYSTIGYHSNSSAFYCIYIYRHRYFKSTVLGSDRRSEFNRRQNW